MGIGRQRPDLIGRQLAFVAKGDLCGAAHHKMGFYSYPSQHFEDSNSIYGAGRAT
ncbi:hypothetical protein PHAMO_170036 [Magnetospirillum molischianum DSM 120]|uniref:Uncharacterized protein n=1 Tax=Magnetospirillum molischianum DSM 120 TaxID=1150626 RepID=H8FNN9_MAGML|nr:hypothetical protein PHAMO_170036 [Magnetospirillum molischianum DSM 120]